MYTVYIVYSDSRQEYGSNGIEESCCFVVVVVVVEFSNASIEEVAYK